MCLWLVQYIKIKRAKEKIKQLQLNLLENDEMMNKYDKYSALGQLTRAEEKWQMMKESILLESAKVHIPVTKRREDKKMDGPRNFRPNGKEKKTKADEQKYRELDKQMKKRCNGAKEHWIDTQCEEIEAYTGVSSKTVHQKIKEFTRKKRQQNRVHTIKRRRHSEWKKRTSSTADQNTSRGFTMMTEAHHLSSIMIKAPKFLGEKVQRTLKKNMKKGKATGPDDTPPEMLTALGEFGIKEITKLVNIIHDAGEIPTDLKKSVYIAIPQKIGTVECDQHRTVCLIATPLKSSFEC